MVELLIQYSCTDVEHSGKGCFESFLFSVLCLTGSLWVLEKESEKERGMG